VDGPWQTLRRGGLPLGAPTEGPPPSAEELGAAVIAVLASPPPPGRARDALSAFVLAWRRQWPRTFARAFGSEAPAVTAWADAAVVDANRYLKLSRIATAHLAGAL
jgi:hypothetical protein